MSEGFGAWQPYTDSKACCWEDLFPLSKCSAELGATSFNAQPLQLARDSRAILTTDASGGVSMVSHTDSTLMGLHGQELGLPAWDDEGFLVFMDSAKGIQAPSGTSRFIVQTVRGGRQIAVVQCKTSSPTSRNAADRLASPSMIKKDLQLLRGCVQRWNLSNPDHKLDLVFIWITTARTSSQLESFARKQDDLIIVDRVATQQLCPILKWVPELYMAMI